VLAIAHRAANSLAGLHQANLWGADVVEADIRGHRGTVEVRHLKTAGPLPFLWDRWELARASDARLGLDELLEADRRGALLMLDLKGRRESLARAVARMLHEQGVRHDVLVCGRHWPSVEHVARLDGVRAVLSARNRVERKALERHLGSVTPSAPYGVSLHVSLLDRPLVSRLLERVRVVMTWPVDDLATLEHVRAAGVNGVITNEPEILRELRRPT
jgi:glycerophosphoryl diester phosphodiesterase